MRSCFFYFLAAALLLCSPPGLLASAPPGDDDATEGAMASTLSLSTAIEEAVATDPWLRGSHHREHALIDESVAAATLPDPLVSLMAANFPTDGFDRNQEPMTQLSVGVSQRFPRGDSLALTRRQKQELAGQEPLLREDRIARVTATVTQLWLEAFEAQESIRLIDQDRSLFEQLVDATSASYASVTGRARQQDIIRAEIEISRLDDRLTMLRLAQESAQRRLSEWIGGAATLPLASELPATKSLTAIENIGLNTDEQGLYEQISQHPRLQAVDQRIEAMRTAVDLAEQKYKPEWGLSARYGHRDDDPTGRSRADLFSLAVTFDLPLFTSDRQDREVSAATGRAESLRTEKQLLARRLLAELQDSAARIVRLDQRQKLFDQQLLPQMAQQAEAELSAYNNDDGDFAEAVRARIDVLNAKIESLSINIGRLKVQAELDYLLSGSGSASAPPTTSPRY